MIVHLLAVDYQMIKDAKRADEVSAIERNPRLAPADSRRRVLDAIRERYAVYNTRRGAWPPFRREAARRFRLTRFTTLPRSVFRDAANPLPAGRTGATRRLRRESSRETMARSINAPAGGAQVGRKPGCRVVPRKEGQHL